MTKIRAKTYDTRAPSFPARAAGMGATCAHLARANMPTGDHLGRYPARWAVAGSSGAIGAVETPTGSHGGCDQRTPEQESAT